MVRKAVFGSRSVLTVAVSVYEGNFSPSPNIFVLPVVLHYDAESGAHAVCKPAKSAKHLRCSFREPPCRSWLSARVWLMLTPNKLSSTKCHIRYILDSSWMP